MRKLFILLGLATSLAFSGCGSKANEFELASMADTSNSLAETAQLANDLDLNTQTPADKKFIKTADLKFKVANVLNATEKIEDITVKYGGYLTLSNLQNRNEDNSSSRISRDSILITKQIVVVNEIQLRVPNERLDSFIRELNPLVVFLDYRVIKLHDVTLQFVANQKKTDRLKNYEQRQTKHIDNKTSKLNETTSAEENLLNRQNQADDLQVASMAIEDRVKYCDLTIEIYQKPIIVKETIARFDYVSDSKPSFFSRVWDSVITGWAILAEFIIFLVKIWGIVLLVIVLFFGSKYLFKLYKKI
jgi:hypothetical protein